MPIFKKPKGIVLITALLVMIVLVVLSVAVISRAKNEYQMAERNFFYTQALYLAEAGVEQASYELGYYVASNYEDPPGSLNGSITISPDFNVGYTCSAYGSETPVPDSYGVVTFKRLFRIDSIATHTESGATETVNQMISRNKTYTFQHAVFYKDDLELLPGPDMTFSGRIHSNSDIYIDTHNNLTVNSEYLYSARHIYNKRKNEDIRLGGTVSVKVTDSENYMPMDPNGGTDPFYDSNHPNWTNEALSRWNGSVRSSAHGVTARATPVIGSILPDGYYAANAGLYVYNDKIYDGVPPALGGSGSQLIEGEDIPNGTVSSSTTFYNNREGKTVKMTDIDLDRLGGGNFDGGTNYPSQLPANGLIYATRDDASSEQQPGIRLKEGSEIRRDSGLTVVTNDPIYIEGDYNTDGDKKPAAVIGDVVNILSNNWNDSLSTEHVDNRVANDTTVNTAFIAGISTTTLGNYNGGLENYPRMHESWSNKNLNIRGSFVSLWNAEIALGDWVYGNPQYKAPGRNWDYDTDFNDVNNLPPFTPFAVETERSVWWLD